MGCRVEESRSWRRSRVQAMGPAEGQATADPQGAGEPFDVPLKGACSGRRQEGRQDAMLHLSSVFMAVQAATTAAGPEISGVVRAVEDGRPLARAVVEIPVIGDWTATDSLGRYRLEELEPGTHRIRYRADGRLPLELTARVPGRGRVRLDVELTQRPTVLPPVVVRADPQPPGVAPFRRISSGVISRWAFLTPGRRCAPSVRRSRARPAALRPPLGFLVAFRPPDFRRAVTSASRGRVPSPICVPSRPACCPPGSGRVVRRAWPTAWRGPSASRTRTCGACPWARHSSRDLSAWRISWTLAYARLAGECGGRR